MLSHEVEPKEVAEKISEYASFIATQSKKPFPEPSYNGGKGSVPDFSQPMFGLVDIATLALYIQAAVNFGFDVSTFIGAEEKKGNEIAADLPSAISFPETS